MSVNPNAFYSIIAIISASLVSLALFFYCRKHFSSAVAPFFKNYIIGFFILGLGFTFHLVMNLGLQLKYPLYTVILSVSQFAIIMAHALFLRGTIMLDLKDKLRTTIFPLMVLPAGAILTILGLILVRVSSFTMFTVMRWGFMIPIKAYLTAIFLYYFFRGSTFDTVKRKFHTFFLGLIWLASLGMDIYLWFSLVSYPQQEFWAMKLASMTGWYILRAIVYWLTLAAILIYSRYLNCLSYFSCPPKSSLK